MNQFNTARRPLPAPRPASTAGSAEARKLAEALMDAMSALLGVIERETELVRAGQVREAMTLESTKQELSRNYVGAVSQLKANQAQLAKSAPELLSTLHRHHDAFRALHIVRPLRLGPAIDVIGVPEGAGECAHLRRHRRPSTQKEPIGSMKRSAPDSGCA